MHSRALFTRMGEERRKNIKVEQATFDRLKEDKEQMQTWDQYLVGLVEGAPIKADVVQVEEEQVREIVREELRRVENEQARKIANELEGRLR
jgi:hypothetical protein